MTAATVIRRAATAFEPHAVLALAAGLELSLEAARTHTGSSAWVLAGAGVALAALLLAWLQQDRLRLLPLAAITVAFHLLWVWTHEILGAAGDLETSAVYPAYGNELLAGRYPEAEYPAGAVVLFAFEAFLGGDSADTPNRLLMVPFQLACVLAVWGLRTPYSRWLAAVIAIWPMNTFFWEYRFDLVPAALLALGLLLAYRGRWGWSGAVLAIGTSVKWTPALAFAVLVAWLLASGRRRESRFLGGGFAALLVATNLPFLLWDRHNFLAPYRSQSGRVITNESVWFFPLELLGLTGDDEREWAPAGAPHAADHVAVGIQLALLAGLIVLAVRNRGRIRPALALAALAPGVFLLTNKIFSAQFLVVLAVGWAIAAALLARGRSEQLAFGLLLMVATLANAFVYPYDLPGAPLSWRPFSALMFTAALVLTSLLVRRAAVLGPERVRPAAAATAPRPAEPSLGWVRPAAAAATSVFFAAAAFVAVVLPYRLADSLTLGAWSRTIAETGAFHLGARDVHLNRPLFYVLQGIGWQALGDHEWLGRLLSVAFGAGLVLCLWLLAGVLVRPAPERALTGTFAIAFVLGSSVFAALVAAGTADLPVATAAAATALLLWSPRVGRMRLYLVTTAAAATLLAKPTGFLAIAGLALATLVLADRARAIEGLVGLAIATVAVAAYSWLEARRLGESAWTFSTAGDADYWAPGTSWVEATLSVEWAGAGARLLVVFGLTYAVARAAGAGPRSALALAGPTAVVLSLVGPAVAEGGVPYPFDRFGPGAFAYVLLSAALLLAPFGTPSDPIDRRAYVGPLLWIAPAGVVWVAARATEIRFLAVTWPAVALLVGAALAVVTLALVRLAPAAALLPLAAVVLLVAANLVAIDGLGRDGWRHVVEVGSSDDFAYGAFSSTLALVRANADPADLVVSNDGRVAYFFPRQVRVIEGDRCSELVGADYFALTLDAAAPDEPLRWLQCRRPRLHLVGQRQGVHAGFVVGDPPARQPTPAACEISGYPGQLHDAVFADGVDYATARSIVRRARGAGFVQIRIERTGCSTFRVLNTGLAATPAGQADFRHEAESVGFRVSFVPAVRHPEVPADVPPPGGSRTE